MILFPNVAFEKVAGEAAGKAEFGADRLVHAPAVEGGDGGREQAAAEQAVEFLALVDGADEIVFLAKDGADEAVDPFGSDAQGIGREDGAGLGAKQIGGGEKSAESGFLAGDAVVGRGDAVEGAEGIRGEEHAEILDRGVLEDFRRAVGRAAVGIDEDAALAVEIFGKADLDGAEDALDGVAVVEGGDADEDIDFTDRGELPKKIFGDG